MTINQLRDLLDQQPSDSEVMVIDRYSAGGWARVDGIKLREGAVFLTTDSHDENIPVDEWQKKALTKQE